MSADVVVIGAGAAGIIAAWRAASLGRRVTLLEKNDRIGIKILISGGGKCNITHDGPIESVLSAFRPNEARFLRPACYRFTNRDIIEMLTSRGLEVYTRPDGRIFPVHATARDVVSILASYLEQSGVRVLLRSAATGIDVDEHGVRAVRVGNGTIPGQRVVVCTGGCSYPATGTVGDGWKWARELGHSVSKVRPALAPIITEPRPPAEWAGVALRDCLLRAKQGGKEVTKWRGDMLFTHRGVSGPTVLGISREVAERLEGGSVRLEVDVLPDVRFEELTARIRLFVDQHPRRSLAGLVDEFLPDRLGPAIMASAGIDSNTTGAHLSQKARNRLVSVLKGWNLGDVAQVPIEKGEVTAGGIELGEVDPNTMRSHIVAGLYLCGEVLDIAGPVGGYNLQAAFATGFVAGESASVP